MVWLVIIVVLAIVAGAYYIDQKAAATADESASMSRPARMTLVGYLLGLGVVLIYLLVKLYEVDFPDRALIVDPPSRADITALSKRTGPVLFHVFPYLKPATATGTVGSYEFAVYGDHFDPKAKVRLNGVELPSDPPIDDDLIRVVPPAEHLDNAASLIVEVVNPDGNGSNALTLNVARPKMSLHAFRQQWPITREIQLILMVLCAGALGSYVHAVKSLADYIGVRRATASWFWWYITRPFLGATMAFIFYAVLRGGFLTGTPADVRVVNPFGAIAVAALIGMFADKASHKLAEIFETLFTAEDKRGGKITGPVIDRLVPPTIPAGASAPIELKILGDRLGRATVVKVNNLDRAPEKVSDREVIVKLQPADATKSGSVPIAVVTPDGTTPSVMLRISDLEITTATLPSAKVGDDYSAKAEAKGGTGPYTWAMQGGPAGLKVDASTGAITGKPTAAGTSKTTVTATDKAGASASKDFDVAISA